MSVRVKTGTSNEGCPCVMGTATLGHSTIGWFYGISEWFTRELALTRAVSSLTPLWKFQVAPYGTTVLLPTTEQDYTAHSMWAAVTT